MGRVANDLERIRLALSHALPRLEISHSVQMDFEKHRVVFVRRPEVPGQPAFYLALAPDGSSVDERVEVRSLDDGASNFKFDGPLAEAVDYLRDEMGGRFS